MATGGHDAATGGTRGSQERLAAPAWGEEAGMKPVHVRRDALVRLTEAAAAVALSVLLGNVRLVELPQGGSIALATLPLLALAIARGPRLGVLAGACAGVAHALSGGTIVHPAQLGLDYLLAYAALGVAGLASGLGSTRLVLAPAIALAMLLHLTAMVVSGAVFFATVAGASAVAYALAYNAATVVPETILAIWLVPPLVRSLARTDAAAAWRSGLLPVPRATARAPRPAPTRTPRPVVDAAPMSIDTTPLRSPKRLTPLRVSRPVGPARTAPGDGSLVRPSPLSAASRMRTSS